MTIQCASSPRIRQLGVVLAELMERRRKHSPIALNAPLIHAVGSEPHERVRGFTRTIHLVRLAGERV